MFNILLFESIIKIFLEILNQNLKFHQKLQKEQENKVMSLRRVNYILLNVN